MTDTFCRSQPNPLVVTNANSQIQIRRSKGRTPFAGFRQYGNQAYGKAWFPYCRKQQGCVPNDDQRCCWHSYDDMEKTGFYIDASGGSKAEKCFKPISLFVYIVKLPIKSRKRQ